MTCTKINMKHFKKAILALLSVSILAVSCQPYRSYTDTATVNGTTLFYAAEGRGKPVILLHGNGGSHNQLETTTRQLAQAGYMVYALDSRGQGANKPIDEYHYLDMATDVKEFIDLKGLHKPAIFGFSDGGIIALQLEVAYPGTAGPIITGGANIFVQNAFVPSFAEYLQSKTFESPLEIMMRDEPDMTVQDMQNIQTPCLILAGEHDLILESHTRLIADNIPGAVCRILPGEDHGSYICNSPKITDLILEFFSRIGY